MNVCLTCFNQFDKVYLDIFHGSIMKINLSKVPCPILECHGSVVEIDDLIAPAILELNKKGYYTEFCCSGHFGHSSGGFYVSFRDDIQIDTELLDQLPKGLHIDVFNIIDPNLTIRGELITTTPDDKSFAPFTNPYDPNLQQYLFQLNGLFYEWVKSLPEYDEQPSMFEDEESFINKEQSALEKIREIFITKLGIDPSEKLGYNKGKITLDQFLDNIKERNAFSMLLHTIQRIEPFDVNWIRRHLNTLAFQLWKEENETKDP